jgi:hypothetical protein
MNKTMKLLVIPFMLLTLGATTNGHRNPPDKNTEKRNITISTCVHQMGKDIWVFETKMDTKTGKIISRKQVHSKKYRNLK